MSKVIFNLIFSVKISC